MIKAAEAQRNVVIQLSLVANPKNESVAGKMIKTSAEIETAAIKASKAAADIRVKISEKELKKREQFNNELLNSINRLGEERLKETQETNKKVVGQLRKITKRMKKIWESLEDAKTDKTKKESDKREKCLENEAKASEKLKAAYKKQIESQQKATEAGLAALQGAMDLTEGLANLGLMSDENFKKFEQGFQKIEAGYKALKGFTELVWKGREAIVAMRESQEALAKTQALLAAAPVPAGIAAATAGETAVAGGVVANHIAMKRVAKEAAEETGERVATKAGSGILETIGNIAANYFGARGFGSAGSAAGQTGKGILSRIGRTTIGGALRGAGSGIVGAGRGVLRMGGSLLGRIGGMSLGGAGGLLAAGTAIGTGLMELRGGVNRFVRGGNFIGSGEGMVGPQQMGFGAYLRGLNPFSSSASESPIHAATSTYGAFRDMWSAESVTERRQGELEKNKVRNQEIRDRQRDQLSFRLAQDSAYSSISRQKIMMGSGTDLEKSKKLEIQAADEVAQARAAAQENYQKQLEAMYRNEAYNNELQLMHLENVRDKESQLADVARTRLGLLESQNQQHKDAVKTAHEELKTAKERTAVAEKAAVSDRESKLAEFDRLDEVKKNNLRSIAEKVKNNQELSFREIKQLEETPFGAEIAQKYRAGRSAGDAETIRALGGFKDAEKRVADAREDESKKRAKLAESIRREWESRDAMAQQMARVRSSMESLAEVTDRVARMRAEQAGVEYTPPAVPARGNDPQNQGGGGNAAAAAINGFADVNAQDTLALIEALRSFSDTNSESYRQLIEELERRAQRAADYRVLLGGND